MKKARRYVLYCCWAVVILLVITATFGILDLIFQWGI
jgi:hypothetical protein